jgi:DNA-directed RNA polymerase alpha subunit
MEENNVITISQVEVDGVTGYQLTTGLSDQLVIGIFESLKHYLLTKNSVGNILKSMQHTNNQSNEKLTDIYMSVRLYNCLAGAGFKTIGDVTLKSEKYLLRIRNMGYKTMKELYSVLRERGLTLKTE